mmetsp:Transcript_98528/g.234625  ORF Transcript_98528/g.234625 Transcript_98528/m.234625 type:complete len:251 (-) Transcript_98528:4396-5148(-)
MAVVYNLEGNPWQGVGAVSACADLIEELFLHCNATGQAGQQLADGHELVLTVLQLLQCVPLHHVEPQFFEEPTPDTAVTHRVVHVLGELLEDCPTLVVLGVLLVQGLLEVLRCAIQHVRSFLLDPDAPLTADAQQRVPGKSEGLSDVARDKVSLNVAHHVQDLVDLRMHVADVHLPSQDLLAPFCAACLKLLPEPALRHAPHLLEGAVFRVLLHQLVDAELGSEQVERIQPLLESRKPGLLLLGKNKVEL